MAVLIHEAFGEKRIAVTDENGVQDIIVHRDLSLNLGDVVMARLTAYQPILKGYFAESDKGALFVPVSKGYTEGQTVQVQVTKEARSGKEATAHPVTSKMKKASLPVGTEVSSKEMDELIEEALRADVPLLNGGVLHIAQTSVCWTIDVDSGTFRGTLDDVNKSAAEMIARQIRLKNMGGLILIDFAGSKRGPARQSLKTAFEQAAKTDSLIADISWTKAGLLEIERRRERSDLWMLFSPDNPLATYYRVRRAIANRASGNPVVRVSPEVHHLLVTSGVRARLEMVFDQPLSYFEIDEERHG